MFRSEPIDASKNQQHRDRRECDVILEKFQPKNIFRARDDLRQADQPLSAAVTVKSATSSSAPTTASNRPCDRAAE